MNESPRGIRAFIAIKAPPDWIEALADLQRKLSRKLAAKEIRWVKPDQFHITLRFLGAVTESEAEEVSRALQDIASAEAAFDLTCSSLGFFPNERRPRVLWAGVERSETVRQLYREVNSRTARIGQPPEDRPFKPHLTLARIHDLPAEKACELKELLDRADTKITSKWRVREVLLMQSHLSPQGASYEVLETAALRTAQP